MKTRITKKLIRKIEAAAQKYFTKASGCHDWTHVERVRNLALKIGKKEKANLEILELAVLLHDVHKNTEMRCAGKFCHAEKGAAEAEKILRKYGLDKNVIREVAHCVKTHRWRNSHQPETIETKVLFDADKLDSIGAVGIARDFVSAGLIRTPVFYTGNEEKLAKSRKNIAYTKDDTAILEYEIKLKHVKNKLLTREGRRIGEERHKFMEIFFKTFWEEARAEK